MDRCIFLIYLNYFFYVLFGVSLGLEPLNQYISNPTVYRAFIARDHTVIVNAIAIQPHHPLVLTSLRSMHFHRSADKSCSY